MGHRQVVIGAHHLAILDHYICIELGKLVLPSVHFAQLLDPRRSRHLLVWILLLHELKLLLLILLLLLL